MDTNKPRTTEVTQAELKLLEACRRDPYLAAKHSSDPDLVGHGKTRRPFLGYAKALAEGLPIGSDILTWKES